MKLLILGHRMQIFINVSLFPPVLHFFQSLLDKVLYHEDDNRNDEITLTTSYLD